MTTFLLARHATHIEQGGRLVGRLDGMSLSDVGRHQALALACGLEGAGIRVIASSPRERAQATAAAIGARLGLPVDTDPDLDEIDYGDWTGRWPADLDGDPRWRSWNTLRATSRVPGGESMLEIQARMVRAAERLSWKHPDDTVLVVSHQDPLRALLAHWLGMPLDFVLRLDLHPASISRIELVHAWPRLVELNRQFG